MDEKNGDLNFIKKVISKNNPSIELCNYVLSGTQMIDKIGNFGL